MITSILSAYTAVLREYYCNFRASYRGVLNEQAAMKIAACGCLLRYDVIGLVLQV